MRKIPYILALLFVPAVLSAQDLNPTVDVTNAYVAGTAGIVKPEQVLSVPDSVMRFDFDFDYEVFDKPYRGAYEFSPYLVQLRPQARPSGENRLFLKAGAGYRFHPEAEVVWTPIQKGGLRVNLFGSHRSYVGKYRGISLSDGLFDADGTRWKGDDLHTTAGLGLRYDWTGGTATFSAAYRNLSVKDTLSGPVSYNGLSLKGRVSNLDRDAAFFYDAALRYDYLAASDFLEGRFGADAELGTPVGNGRLLGSLHVEVDKLSGNTVGNLYAVPRYAFALGDVRFDLGVRLSAIFRSGDSYHPKSSGIVFPAAKVDWYLLDDQLVLQASATGGDHLNLYGDLLDSHHFLRSCMGWDNLDNSVERVTLKAGVRGHVIERFHYDLQLGYTRWQNGLLWCPWQDWRPGITYTDYNLFFADLTLGWKSSRVDADGHFRLGNTNIDPSVAFVPATFTGDARACYKWGDRIRAGADVSWSGKRTGMPGSIPGFVDLGLYGEFALNRTFGLWGRVGNLLNQTIQRTPFYAEDGIWFTAGIRLNL